GKSAIDASDASTVAVSGGKVNSIDYGIAVFDTVTLTVSGNYSIIMIVCIFCLHAHYTFYKNICQSLQIIFVA
ncbi:MAG: hypothetical protein IIU42_01110, partial [Ruminococcus sp.]|nr:hypothetical protein [Ruminococcus sp.]